MVYNRRVESTQLTLFSPDEFIVSPVGTLPALIVDLTPVIITPAGKRIEVPIDRSAITELQAVFARLSRVQQDWLMTRFLTDENDEETTRVFNRRAAVDGKVVDRISVASVKRWKGTELDFRRAYDILSSRAVDWFKLFALNVETRNAVAGALEKAVLIEESWVGMDGRKVTAKMQAIEGALGRVLGSKAEVTMNIVSVEDLIKR